MINRPIYRPSASRLKAGALRKSKFRAFIDRYPTAFVAWVERLPDQSVRTLWSALVDLHLSPELKVLIVAGKDQKVHLPVSSQDLWDAWFRAAVTCLVAPIGDRVEGDFTVLELANAFGIPLTRYQGLVDKERAWVKRPMIKPPKVQRRGLIAGQPDVEDLYVRLIK